MDVTPLPTVAELQAWMRVGPDALKLAEDVAAPAWDIRQALSGVYTSQPLWVWYHPTEKQAWLQVGDHTEQDEALVKMAVEHVVPVVDVPTIDAGIWVKVAFSPFLRHLSEAWQLHSGNYPGGLPNLPGPYTSMLAGGLVGAGLGYGGGALAEQLMPDRWERGRLRKTLALVGGLAGAAPGVVYGAINKGMGRSFGDNRLLADAPVIPPQMGKEVQSAVLGDRYTAACAHYVADLGSQLKEASEALADGGNYNVNIDALGHTLWESGASPQIAGMTMGAMAAAQQMPGGTDEPGWVTPMQVASLAAHMGVGYVSGALVGEALGLLTGMPEDTQKLLRNTGMYSALAGALIPRLFRR